MFIYGDIVRYHNDNYIVVDVDDKIETNPVYVLVPETAANVKIVTEGKSFKRVERAYVPSAHSVLTYVSSI